MNENRNTNRDSNFRNNKHKNYDKNSNFKPKYSDKSSTKQPNTSFEKLEIEDTNSYIYGRNAITEALNEKDKISKVFVMFGAEGPNIDKINSLCYKYKIPVVKYDKRKFADLENRIGAKGNSQGVIALINLIENIEFEELLDNAKDETEFPLIIALDEINDPHNLGAIARSVVCSGAVGLILPKGNSVQITPTAIKISAGALLHTKISQVKSLQSSLEYALENGYQVIGTEMEAETNYFDINYKSPTIIVIGSEAKGIRPSIQKICTKSIKIPMKGQLNSLNASVSAGILLFEAAKQKM